MAGRFWILAFVLLLAGPSCVTTADYGAGECKEYKPLWCARGQMVCRTDDRGCELCTCR